MRFSFRAPDARGLRVIEEIPDLEFCHLEGRNGIGKTLSVRLLELVSGSQPFAAMPRAWETLRDQLGDTFITVEGMEEGTVEVHLTPTAWPLEPIDAVGDDLGSVTIGGQPVGWEELRSLLRVERIAGDETLTETLAKELEQRGVTARFLAEDVGPVVAAWDEILGSLSNLTEGLEPGRIEELERAAKEAQAATQQARRLAATAQLDLDAARDTHQAVTLALHRWTKLPSLLDELDSARGALRVHDERVLVLNRELEKVAQAGARTAMAAEDLSRWQRLTMLRTRAVSRATIAEREAMRLLGLTSRPSALELDALMTEAQEQQAAAKRRLQEIDVIGHVRRLITRLREPLDQAPASVDDQVVANLPSPATTAQLRRGVRDREVLLADIPKSGEVEDLEVKAAAAEKRLARLFGLRALMETTDRKTELLVHANEQVSTLLTQGRDEDKVKSVAAELHEEQRRRLTAALELVAVAQQLAELLGTQPIDPRSLIPDVDAFVSEAGDADDGEADDSEEAWPDLASAASSAPPPPDPATDASAWAALAEGLDRDAAQKVHSLLQAAAKELGYDGGGDGDLAETASAVSHILQERSERYVSAAKTASDARAAWTHAAERRAEAIGRLNAAIAELRDSEGPWVPFAPGLAALMGPHNPELSILDAARSVASVAAFSTLLRNAVNDTRDRLNAVSGILSVLAGELSARVASAHSTTVWAKAIDLPAEGRLRRWAELELATVLGAPALRSELFDGADQVSVDLRKATVRWTTRDDRRPRLRPLEAFSSGEQVFAYTRAKLDLLRSDAPRAAHVVVVLDEFGAFVARDRFGQLLQFVREQALGSIAEQVIVMLPLAEDYTAHEAAEELERDAATDPTSEYLMRVGQVARRQYFAVPADPVGV